VKWLAKIIGSVSPNCREAIRLQSEALDHPLTWLQRVGLRIHLILCVWCLRYGKQIQFLRTTAQQCDHEHSPKQILPKEARERIKEKLEAAAKKGP